MITGVDLVELQLKVAQGQALEINQAQISVTGAAIEARVYAENPAKGFLPTVGKICQLDLSNSAKIESTRLEHALIEGLEINTKYDPMLAKVISQGRNREEARGRLIKALEQFNLLGLEHNIYFLRQLLQNEAFISGTVDTKYVEKNITEIFDSGTSPLVFEKALAIFLSARSSQLQIDLNYFRPAHQLENKFTNIFEACRSYTILCPSTGLEKTLEARCTKYSETKEGAPCFLIEMDQTEHQIKVLTDSLFEFNGQILSAFKAKNHIISFDHLNFYIREHLSTNLIEDRESRGALEIRSPLPGKVISVKVAENQAVQAGETLLSIESMKMEHLITSPTTASVKRVFVQAEDTLSENDLLIILSGE